MLPIFLQELSQANRFLVWGCEKQGKMLPIFFQELSQANRFLVLCVQNRTKRCRVFSKNFLRQIDFWFGGLK